PAGSLPVGLTASKVISNALLFDFDRLVKERLAPIYYGRYVDDVFLVLRCEDDVRDGVAFMRMLASKLGRAVKFENGKGGHSLQYLPSFAQDSTIVFSGEKQKIFCLHGKSGQDLVDQISEQIRRQVSEHRLLPALPETESEMLAQALLATPDA